MQHELLPRAGLADFYRFALLLTGDHAAAERAFSETLREGERRIADIRDEARRAAWLATRIRQRCMEISRDAESETGTVADRFHSLPEPERSALALFYLDPFSPDQIAQILGMNIDRLAETLTRARAFLQRARSREEAAQ